LYIPDCIEAGAYQISHFLWLRICLFCCYYLRLQNNGGASDSRTNDRRDWE
jgi:hypothetical protein